MKKNILITVCTLIIIACSAFLYVNEDNIFNLVNNINFMRDFNTNDILKNDKTIISFSETTDNYINFSIENNNGSGEKYYLNTFFTLTNMADIYKGKNVVAVVEESVDNLSFNSIGERTLSLNNKVNLITDELLATGNNYYRISFKIDNQIINIKEDNILGKLDVKTNLEFKFNYEGEEQEFTAPVTGEYRIELWGASGNAYNNTHGIISGKGAYTAGTINLKKDTKLYIYTGQNSTNGTAWNESSYGGGGKGGGFYYDSWFTSLFPNQVTDNVAVDYSNAKEILTRKVKNTKQNIIEDENIILMLNRLEYVENQVDKYKKNEAFITSLNYLINKYRTTELTFENIMREIYSIMGNKHFGASGGGATDVRLVGGPWNNEEGLRSRIMVAAGGGGALYKMLDGLYLSGCSGAGGSAGGLVGYQGQIAYIGLAANFPDETGKAYLNNIISRYPKGGVQTSGGKKGVCLGLGTNGIESYYESASSVEFYCENLKMNDGRFAYGGDAMKVNATSTKPDGQTTTLSSGGGGGYYGGAGSSQTITSKDEFYYFAKNVNESLKVNLPGHTSGAGGSSYISGHTGSIAIASASNETPKSGCIEQGNTPDNYVGTADKSCSIHYSDLSFKDTVMIDGEGYSWTNKREGKTKMPSYNGTAFESGNTGSGAARITLLSENFTAESTWEKTEKDITVVDPVKITVKYVDENGKEIENQEIITNKDGKTNYETISKEIKGYKLVETPANASGSFPEADITVVYKYRKIQLVNVEDTLKQSILYIVLGGVISIFGLILFINNKRVNKI